MYPERLPKEPSPRSDSGLSSLLETNKEYQQNSPLRQPPLFCPMLCSRCCPFPHVIVEEHLSYYPAVLHPHDSVHERADRGIVRYDDEGLLVFAVELQEQFEDFI